MNSRPQLETLANYLTDFITSVPPSTRAVVSTHIQQCLQAVANEFELVYARLKQLESADVEQKTEGPA